MQWRQRFGWLWCFSFVVFSSGIVAQERPDLSGSWSATTNSLSLEIELDDSCLIVRSPVSAGGELQENRFVYRLDESENRNEFLTAANITWEEVSHARWVAGAVVVTARTYTGTGGFYETLTTYYIEPDGKLVRSSLSGVLNGPSHAMTEWAVEYERQ